MRRLPSLLGACAGLLAAAPLASAAVVSTTPVPGRVVATAFAGDALVLARRPESGAARVELRRPGQAPKVVLSVPDLGDDSLLTLAASPAALAVSLIEDAGDDEEGSPSRVWVGALDGPLREVATCRRAVYRPLVAVDGSRVAWADGGCGGATGQPQEVGPAAFAFADADPAVPVRRVPVPEDQVPASLALGGGGAVGALLRPTFFGFSSDIRAVGDTLGPVRDRVQSGVLAPFGVLADGSVAVTSTSFAEGDFSFDEENRPCAAQLAVLPPTGPRRPLDAGGCPDTAAETLAPVGVFTGDRLVTLVGPRRPRPLGSDAQPLAITAVRPDGTDRKTIVTGTYRKPLGFAAAPGRFAWWQDRCTGGQELVLAGGPVAATRSCTVDVLTRRAKVTRGRASLRVRCAAGCRGTIVDESQCGRQPRVTFTIPRGTRTVRLLVPARQRRAGRVLLRFGAPGGPTRRQLVRVS